MKQNRKNHGISTVFFRGDPAKIFQPITGDASPDAEDSIPELMEKRGTHDVFGQASKKVEEEVRNAS